MGCAEGTVAGATIDATFAVVAGIVGGGSDRASRVAGTEALEAGATEGLWLAGATSS